MPKLGTGLVVYDRGNQACDIVNFTTLPDGRYFVDVEWNDGQKLMFCWMPATDRMAEGWHEVEHTEITRKLIRTGRHYFLQIGN